MFQFLIFYNSPHLLKQLPFAKDVGFVVDLETKNKDVRQSGFGTQITTHTLDDLAVACAQFKFNITCRINGPGLVEANEIEQVIDAGAIEILLPMVRIKDEILNALSAIDNRVKLAVMIETEEIIEILPDLEALPISSYSIGLNDLAIQRQSQNIFMPIVDGTIEKMRASTQRPLGFGGLTHPALGDPLPCKLLIKAMIYHRCQFSFLRRSFYRDQARFTAPEILQALRSEFNTTNRLSLSNEEQDVIRLAVT